MRFLLSVVSFLVVGLDASTSNPNPISPLGPKINMTKEHSVEKEPTTTLGDQNKEKILDQITSAHLAQEEATNSDPKAENLQSTTHVPESDMLWWESDTLVAVDGQPFAEGSFGAVYRAYMTVGDSEHSVVVKSIIIDESDAEKHDKQIQAVVREVENLGKINSPYVVKLLHGFWREDDDGIPQSVMVMENGGIFSLFDLYNSSRLGPVVNDKSSRFERVRYFSICIALGLHACHQHGILHRDVALKNILVSAVGQVKLCDFGLSCALDEKGQASGAAGTPFYICRKAMKRLPYGVDADYYSLGACMFALDQMKEPLEDVVKTMEDLIKWHEDGREMHKLLSSKFTDQRVIDAIHLLCDLHVGKVTAFLGLQLFQDLKAVTPPACVLRDIEVLVEEMEGGEQ